MELLFATLGGAILGLAARYFLPHRETSGALLIPAVGAMVSAIVWSALTWVGWKFDAGWIWVVSLAVAAIVAGLVSVAISRQRARGDVRMLAQLSHA